MKKFTQPLSILCSVLILLTVGCKKEVALTQPSQIDKDPVSAIRSIVGNKGTISLLNNHQISYSKSESVKDSNLRILSIQEFREFYQSLNSIEYVQIGLDSSLNTKKSSSEYADDDYDDPGKPGLHKVQFYAAPFSYFNGTYGINNSNIPLSILNLWYETDIHGKVIGNPQLFYTGISLLQIWTQLTTTSIQFNQTNYTSNFSIGGSTLYGISVYGQNIGWTTSSRYIIKIIMDSNNGDDGKVTIIAEQY